MDSQRFDRVAEVFEKARGLEGAERHAWLEEACAGDTELRREVESLLAEYGSGTSSIEPVTDAALLRRMAALPAGAADSTDRAGKPSIEVPGFRILSQLGEGAQGTVYEAEQKSPRRVVALKILRPHLGGSSVERRFEREAEALARLQHPGIAVIHESGVVTTNFGSLPYFAMELVRGHGLFEHCRVHELSVDERLSILAEVCDAVAHAHERGIVHRDLKPSNILVDADGRPRVLDFGVARIIDADIESATLETRTGQVIGTLSYMSPEQAAGRPDAVDQRADVFALGVLAFELLTGRLPRDLTGHSLPEQVRMLAEGETTLLGTVDRALRGDIETIVAKALAQDAERRYASASALAEDLRRYLASEPIAARPATTAYHVSRFVRRHRGLSIALAALVATLITGTIVSLALYFESRASEEQAEWQSYVANLTAASAQLDASRSGAAERLAQCSDRFRNTWEWRHLNRRADESLAVISGSASSVHSVAYGAGGLIASGGGRDLGGDYGEHDYLVRIWRLEQEGVSAQLVHELGPHANAVRGLAFDPSTNELVSLSRADEPSDVPGEVRVWNAESGTQVAALSGEEHDWTPTAVAWVRLPGGETRVAVGGADGVSLWDPKTGAFERVLVRASAVNTLAFAAQNARLVVGLKDGSVSTWQLRSDAEAALVSELDLADRVRADAEIYSEGVTALAVQDDGGLLVGLEGGALVVVESDAATIESVLVGHNRTVTAVRWSPDGSKAWSTSLDGTLRTWDVARGEELDARHGHAGMVTALDVIAGSDRLVTGSYDQTLRLWDADGDTLTFRGPAMRHVLAHTLEFDSSSTYLAWRSDVRTLNVFDLARGVPLYTLPAFSSSLKGVLFDRPGAGLRTFEGDGGQLLHWDARGRQDLKRSAPELPDSWRFGFSHDGRLAAASATIDNEWRIEVRDVESGKVVRSWPADSPAPYVCFTRDDRSVVYSLGDGTILVSDVATGEVQHTFAVDGAPYGVAASPTEDLIAVTTMAPADYSLWLFDLTSGERREMPSQTKPFVLTFTPDGSRIVTGARDHGTVTLWDIERGPTLVLSGLEGTIQQVSVSPDGRCIAAVDSGGTHRLWRW